MEPLDQVSYYLAQSVQQALSGDSTTALATLRQALAIQPHQRPSISCKP